MSKISQLMMFIKEFFYLLPEFFLALGFITLVSMYPLMSTLTINNMSINISRNKEFLITTINNIDNY